MRLNFDKHFKMKMSDRNFTQRFDVFMTSLSSNNKITVPQCYICGERCDYSLTYLFKQIVSRGWNPILLSLDGDVMGTSKRCVKFLSLIFILKTIIPRLITASGVPPP